MDSSDIIEMGNGPVEVDESDSGDSLFLTQIPQNLIPNAARLRYRSPRSMSVSPSFLEAESSSSNEDERSPRRRKRRPELHKYNFPFLNQKKLQLPADRFLPAARNRAIHHRGVEGFFNCIGEMWPSGQRRESFESTLPTVDTDDEEITPITEDDESGEEDIKIIDKRLFVYSVQPKITKSSQIWFTSWRNKIAETTKPTRKSISQQHFGAEKTSQSTSNMPEDLSKELYVVLDSSSDSDETFIEESIKPSDHGDVLSPLDESVDSESQSILQNNPLDIRGRHSDNIYDVKELLSTKTKQGDKRLEYENGTMNTSLSQESIDLFEDYITSYQSPLRNTPRKTDSNDLITENNGDTAEKLDDVESDLEATSLTELMPASCNQEKQVKRQNLPKDAELLLCTNDDNNGDGTVQKKKKHKKKKGDVHNKRTEQNGTSLGNNQEKEVSGQSLPEDSELLSCQNVDVQDNGDGTAHKKKKHKKKKGDVHNKRTEQNGTNLGNNQEKEVSGQSLPEDSELLSCPNVDFEDNGDRAIHKKKKHKKKKGDVKNEETERNSTSLHPQQILNNLEKEVPGQSLPEDTELLPCENVDIPNNSEGTVRKKKKHKKKKGDVENEETEQNWISLHPQQILNNLEKEVPGQSLPEDIELLSCENVDIPNNSEGTVRKKKKHKKKNGDVETNDKEQNGTYLDPLQIENNGQSDNKTAVDKTVSDMSDNKRKQKKKQKAARECDDEFALKEFQLNTNKNASSGLVDSQEISKLVNNYNTDADCLAIQGDEPVSVRKKKKKHVSSAEREQNGTYLDPLQIVNNEKLDVIITVDKIMSDMSGNERKHKRKRKAVSDEDLALKKFPLRITDKNSSSGLVRNCENSELVNNDNTDTDCLVIQGDESVSVMKKKKKRKVHPMAETVENVTLDVSLSGEGHGADGLDISTNYIESAENNTCLQATELGNKVKKKKRNGELNNLGPNAKIMENTEMNECNKGSDCDSTEVNQPLSDEGDRLKKKKKKKKNTQSEHCQTGMEKTTAGGVKESAVLSPKESECPERKKRDKKRQLCGGQSVLVETSEETGLEQSTVKRKKHKRYFKDHEQTVSTPLHVEISPSSGKLEKNVHTEVKKRLYNPNNIFFNTH